MVNGPVWLVALAVGCGNAGPGESAGAGSARGEAVSLVPTLSVVVAGDSVRFWYRVANGGASVVEVAFASGQRFDFVVRDVAGAEIWRWSSDRMFAQATGSEQLEPGEVLEYEATWDPGERAGVYRAVARLTSSDRPLELETEFELGGQSGTGLH